MEEDKKERLKRLQIWALFLIGMGILSAFIIPEEKFPSLIDLFKDIITNLVI